MLVLALGALIILSIGSRRNSKLYRVKVAVLGLIVSIWGEGLTGPGCLPKSGTECYAPIYDYSWDFTEDELEADMETVDSDDLTESEEYDIPEVEEVDELDGFESDAPDAQECEAIDMQGEEVEDIEEVEEVVDADDVETEGDVAEDTSNEDLDGA